MLLVLLLTSCTSWNRRLEVSTIRNIQPGQITRPEVEGLLGKPAETVTGPERSTVVRYFFREFRRSTDASWYVQREHPGDILLRTLTLAYNPSNVVQRKLHDESVTPIYRTNAWLFAGPSLRPETIAFIQKGATTEHDVIARLGEPASRTFNEDGRSVLVWFHIEARETAWTDPDVHRLMLSLDEDRIVRDFVLVEHTLSEIDPIRLH